MNSIPLQRRTLKSADLIALSRDVGGELRIAGNRDLDDEALHRGTVSFTRLNGDLSVHTVDITNMEDFAAEVSMPPSLSFSFVLSGGVTMTIGESDFAIGPAADGSAQGGFLYLSRPDRFTRRAQRDQRLRAAVVVTTPEWVMARMPDHEAFDFFVNLQSETMAYSKWNLSPRQVIVAEQLLQPPQFEPLLHNLFFESRAIEAIAEALRSLSGAEPMTTLSLRRRDRERLEAVKEFIESDAAIGLSLADMAKRFGVNVKILQHEFRLAFGTTIFNYLKEHRLNKAREALLETGITVSEAAFLAGYASPANFATAFKKRFGMSPKDIRLR